MLRRIPSSGYYRERYSHESDQPAIINVCHTAKIWDVGLGIGSQRLVEFYDRQHSVPIRDLAYI